MRIQPGFYYHIKDVFFEEIQDSTLMSNKEDGNYPTILPYGTPDILKFSGWFL